MKIISAFEITQRMTAIEGIVLVSFPFTFLVLGLSGNAFLPIIFLFGGLMGSVITNIILKYGVQK